MSVLQGKKVVLGVTGGIAAYKSAVLLRALMQAGAIVRVVMTPAAQAFVTPLTFQALSKQRVYTELFDTDQEAAMSHIDLARWADLVLVAPASADFMARLAAGMANDLLSTLSLATTATIALAPAMNQQMWLNPATQENVRLLRQRGLLLWGPSEGEQACGEAGPGRMLEPDLLLAQAESLFASGSLQGKRVLITAGPTREFIDPVRYVGNRSSGKMGYALAASLVRLGAEVTLISGPVALTTPDRVLRVDVETALQMKEAVMARASACDIFVGVAAVADYRPTEMAAKKIKKSSETLQLNLRKNPDILALVAALDEAPYTVGFAAETDDVEAFADAKRRAKKVDLIAANRVGGSRGGFERDENALLLLWEGGREAIPMMTKPAVAERLAERIAEQYHNQANLG